MPPTRHSTRARRGAKANRVQTCGASSFADVRLDVGALRGLAAASEREDTIVMSMFKLKLSSAATDDGSVTVSRRTWTWWIVGTLATLPASALLWFVGAMSAGGGEDYDPPAPAIVDSGIPGVWVAIALVPAWLALVGGSLQSDASGTDCSCSR